ncbi:transcription factor TGA7-like isoform X2 [Momordica charantia]|uniref:Transcription factor TGA7-like isoform X2 n=1 Tax=Momordica charantia TaxID=3673 RepID=A0A6J1DE31_MOMCH|nr:transcription factor TGA7-like isoform X2 [Momordica charantia]
MAVRRKWRRRRKERSMSMSSSSTQLCASRMGIYEPFHQFSSWGNAFGSRLESSVSPIIKVDDCVDNKPEFIPSESMDHLESSQEMNKPINDKVQRRLAQNREAARKSRMRKKVYVQQLETSRLKLAQLEQELERTRQKGVYSSCVIDTGHLGFGGSVNPGIAAFETEYNHWVEEQQRQIIELRKALQLHITDIELQILVESSLKHYYNLFCMKQNAARADVFYLMSGVWRTSAERFFLWIGGFRPSELLNVLKAYLEPLNEQQRADIHNLQQSSRQAEDALSQGMEKLHQNLSHSIANDPLGSYISQMGDGMEKLEVLKSFISQPSDCYNFLEQADHLRQETLKRMSHILTTKQAAQGLLALGEYFHRLRVLSSLWSARPREPS